MTFPRSLGHTREDTGREGVQDHFPIRNRAYGAAMLKSTRRWLLVIKNDKARFLQGRERGSWGIFELNEYIFFIFVQFFLSRAVLFWYSPLPLPHNFSNGPSLIGVVPSLYIEGGQTSG